MIVPAQNGCLEELVTSVPVGPGPCDSYRWTACKQVHLPYLGEAKFGINQLVTTNERNAKLCWDNAPSRLHRCVVAFADVVDVHRYGCIRANSIFLHFGHR